MNWGKRFVWLTFHIFILNSGVAAVRWFLLSGQRKLPITTYVYIRIGLCVCMFICIFIFLKVRREIHTPHTQMHAGTHTDTHTRHLRHQTQLCSHHDFAKNKEQIQLHVWLSSTLAQSHLQIELPLCWWTQTTEQNTMFGRCHTVQTVGRGSIWWHVLLSQQQKPLSSILWTQRGSVRQGNGSTISHSSFSPMHKNTTRGTQRNIKVANRKHRPCSYLFIVLFFNLATQIERPSEDDSEQWRRGQ